MVEDIHNNIVNENNTYYTTLLNLATDMNENSGTIQPKNYIKDYDHQTRINPNIIKEHRINKRIKSTLLEQQDIIQSTGKQHKNKH